jgi:hypothetical protein
VICWRLLWFCSFHLVFGNVEKFSQSPKKRSENKGNVEKVVDAADLRKTTQMITTTVETMKFMSL